MNYWVLLYRVAWVVVGVSIAVAVVCVFLPRANNLQELQKRRAALQQGNARLEDKLRQLEDNEHRFRSDPEFVERTAREQGMARPGETIFRFQGTNIQSVTRRP